MQAADWLKQQKPLAGRLLFLAVALGALNGWLLIVQAWLLARAVSAVVFEKAEITDIMPWMWPMLGIFLLRAGLAWASEQVAFRAAARVKVSLRDRLFRHIQALGPVYLHGERSGDLGNALTDGIEAIEAYYARYLPAMSLMALIPLAILVFVFPLDWISGLILLVTAPLIPLFMILIGKGAEALNQRQWRKLARMSAHFLDVIQGLTTLKLFNSSRREAEIIARISDDYRRTTLSVLRVAFLSSAVLEFFATVSIALVAVGIGFRLLWGQLDFFSGFFILLLAPEFYLPLRNMGTHYHARLEAIGAAERIVEILDTEPPQPPARPVPTPRSRAIEIRFDDVAFAYEPGRVALDGVDLEIVPGERVAVVGASGSGKTTLINALLGFITPDRGEIRINGIPLRTLDLEDWHSRLAWLPQQPRLFQGTILDNIRLGRPSASAEEVHEATERAQAHEFIQAMSAGYDTPVGERGAGLSGGQIQRIALARAFLRDAPVVVLDEATAHLDPESDALIQSGIRELARGRTLLAVAHRLATVRDADRIFVMDRGRVAESGDHDTLLSSRGVYARMVAAYGLPA